MARVTLRLVLVGNLTTDAMKGRERHQATLHPPTNSALQWSAAQHVALNGRTNRLLSSMNARYKL